MELGRQLDDIQRLGQLGCWEWDVRADRVTWTDGLYRIYGINPAGFVATYDGYLARVHEGDREHVAGAIRSAFRAGTGFSFEERIVRPDGSIRILHSVGRVERDEQDDVLRLVGVCRDITEMRAAEQANLRLAEERAARLEADDAERRQRFLAAATAEMAASLDYEATLATVARMAVPTMADWCAVDLIDDSGELSRLAVEHSDPEKVELARILSERYAPARDPSRGTWRVIVTGQSEHVGEITDDILAERAIDAEHLALLRQLGLRSYVIAPLGSGARVLGTITFVQAESERSFDAADIAILEDLARRGAVAIENAHVVRELECAQIALLDQSGELEAQAAELEAQTEELQHMMTELEQRNEELQLRTSEAEAARQIAEVANQSKAQFLATMSHELRTPLNAIAGYTQLLELGIHGPVTDRQLDTFKRIQHNQRHLLSLINDILNFTRIQAGRLPVRVETVDVAELLEGLEPLVAPQVRMRGLMLQMVRPAAGVTIAADRERAEQVLLNLLSNAIKFTAPGGSVNVRADVDRDRVAIHVADTGRGIEAERLETIFDPFVQIDTAHTREVEGVGLGLSISRELARAMGGDISVRSELGRGSVFTVALRRPHPGDAVQPVATSTSPVAEIP